MNKLVLIMAAIIALSGCQRANELSMRMGMKERPQKYLEGSNYYEFPEISPGKQYRSESTFCYKVQTDVLCYDQPRKGWEDRMVGFQEPLRPVARTNNTYAQNQNNYAPRPVASNNTSSSFQWPSLEGGQQRAQFNPKYSLDSTGTYGRRQITRAVAENTEISSKPLAPLTR